MKKAAIFLAMLIMLCPALMATGMAEAPEVKPLWEAGQTRDKIVIISDLHLGIDDRYSETVENRPLLVDFLNRICATGDVKELVIAGDFLDTWYLPVFYPSYEDDNQFYRDVIANNSTVFEALNRLTWSGVKLVYVPGNHDLTLEASVLQEAVPAIVQVSDAQGLGAYYAGCRNEIVIEHGHRYDVFSAPDTLSNAELCGNDDTILPAGYFYARYGATWVIEGRPAVQKDLPVVTVSPDKSDTDQYGAFVYYSVLQGISKQITPNEALDQKIFDIHIAGFDDAYTYLDFFPAQMADGTISAPTLYRNIQRTWADRQNLNNVKVSSSFIESVLGATDWPYFFLQARRQYLENPGENVDIEVFGHTHVPSLNEIEGGKAYVNSGTWVDHNSINSKATCIFAVITTAEKDSAMLGRYEKDGSITDVSQTVF